MIANSVEQELMNVETISHIVQKVLETWKLTLWIIAVTVKERKNNMKIIPMPNYNATISFEISKGQIESLINFIDLHFISSIRNDEDVDNMDYICNICDIYRNLTKAQETIWDNEEKLYNDKVGEQNE